MNVHAPINADTSLASRAMVVSLRISQWSAQRLDRRVTEEVTAQNKAAADAGNFNKHLLPREALEGISKVVGATRQEFISRTLPWLNDGSRIMNAAGFFAHSDWFRGQRDKFNIEVNAFVAKYPVYVQDAQRRLGDMFDPADFPTAADVRNKFDMAMQIMPAPSADDFRVAMSEAQAAGIRAQIEADIEAATKIAVKHVYERVADVAQRMVDRLTAYKPAQKKGERAEGIFRDSLVTNVRELCTILPTLNITGDKELEALGDQLQALGKFDPDVLRNSEAARERTKQQANDILNQIGDFLG